MSSRPGAGSGWLYLLWRWRRLLGGWDGGAARAGPPAGSPTRLGARGSEYIHGTCPGDNRGRPPGRA